MVLVVYSGFPASHGVGVMGCYVNPLLFASLPHPSLPFSDNCFNGKSNLIQVKTVVSGKLSSNPPSLQQPQEHGFVRNYTYLGPLRSI